MKKLFLAFFMLIICFNVFTQNIGDIIINDYNGPIISTVERIFEDGRIYYGYSLLAYLADDVFAQLEYKPFYASLKIYIKKTENNFPDFDGIRIIYQYNNPEKMIYMLPNRGYDEYIEYHSELFVQNVDMENYRIGKINDGGIIAKSIMYDAYVSSVEETIERINREEYKMYSLDLPPRIPITNTVSSEITGYLAHIKNIIICFDGFSGRPIIDFYEHCNIWLARYFSMVDDHGIK